MEYSYFDIIVSIVVLFLGLKGILNGFFKELFGLLGIVGGIFVASRVGDSVGLYLSDLIFKFENSAAVNFTGFLVTLAIFWLLMVGIGLIFKKLSSMSGLGIFDRILGFIFGSSKFFLIAAVIAFSVYNIKSMRSTIDSLMENSTIFPILVDTGAFIMKIDTTGIAEDINSTIDEGKKAIIKKIDDTIIKSAQDIVDETKQKIQDTIKETTEQNSSKEEE